MPMCETSSFLHSGKFIVIDHTSDESLPADYLGVLGVET